MTQPFAELDHLDTVNFDFDAELEKIKLGNYDVKYPGVKAREVLPLALNDDPTAETITYDQYDSAGMAKLIANYSDDIPRVDVLAKKFSVQVHPMADSYGYSVHDVRKALKNPNKSLPAARARAAREAMLRLEDQLAATGNTGLNMVGFANNPNVSQIDAATVDAQTEWSAGTKTGEEVLADIFAALNKIKTVTKGVEFGDAAVFPEAQYDFLSQKMLSQNNVTILQHLVATNRFPGGIYSWNKLQGAGEAGSDRAVIFNRNPDKLELCIPLEFLQHEEEKRGLEYVVICEERFAGVLFYRPLSMCYLDHI